MRDFVGPKVADKRGIQDHLIRKGPDCGIQRNATKIKDAWGRDMFFLLRMAFWLGLVLVLLPRDEAPEANKEPRIGASEAVSAATAAVSDMSQFCKRQPAACEVGGQAASAIGQRAQDGARKLYRIITEKRPPDHTGSIDAVPSVEAAASGDTQHGTLIPQDLEVEWHLAAPMAAPGEQSP
ncbi:hypothetical protein NB311A_18056 [Nitrobacter sp. Nb-311A]|nr:hypothetical protein NB311A_18056 [Nitrobacter sp. Nb-311A]